MESSYFFNHLIPDTHNKQDYYNPTFIVVKKALGIPLIEV